MTKFFYFTDLFNYICVDATPSPESPVWCRGDDDNDDYDGGGGDDFDGCSPTN